MTMFIRVLVLAAVLISQVSFNAGDWFRDEYVSHKGLLRCYQCNSTQQESEIAKRKASGIKSAGYPYCKLESWKHANVTEKRSMMMQCPTQMTAFCLLLIDLDSQVTLRGCQPNEYRGPAGYTGPKIPHPGCFFMYRDNKWYRACLCDTDLCNSSHILPVPSRCWYIWLTILLTVFKQSVFNLV